MLWSSTLSVSRGKNTTFYDAWRCCGILVVDFSYTFLSGNWLHLPPKQRKGHNASPQICIIIANFNAKTSKSRTNLDIWFWQDCSQHKYKEKWSCTVFSTTRRLPCPPSKDFIGLWLCYKATYMGNTIIIGRFNHGVILLFAPDYQKFPMTYSSYFLKFWLAVQCSFKDTASWLPTKVKGS